MISILNLHNNKPHCDYDVVIDRTSILGNKHFMKDESQRDKVCDDYEKWFKEKLFEDDKSFKAELDRLYNIYIKFGKLRLFCWCAPQRCHGRTIKKYIENMSWGFKF